MKNALIVILFMFCLKSFGQTGTAKPIYAPKPIDLSAPKYNPALDKVKSPNLTPPPKTDYSNGLPVGKGTSVMPMAPPPMKGPDGKPIPNSGGFGGGLKATKTF